MTDEADHDRISAATRASARRTEISLRMIFFLAVLGFEIMALLIGLILGFWFLAYIGGAIILLAIVAGMVAGGLGG